MKDCRIKKIFENWSGIKTIQKKTKVLKFIWKLESRKLNLRIRILEIKFERNWNFENYLKIGVLEIKFKNLDFGN